MESATLACQNVRNSQGSREVGVLEGMFNYFKTIFCYLYDE
jgi:hypothetical protein